MREESYRKSISSRRSSVASLKFQKTHMDAGHGGGSGRDRAYEELAFEFAFILDLLENDDTDSRR